MAVGLQVLKAHAEMLCRRLASACRHMLACHLRILESNNGACLPCWTTSPTTQSGRHRSVGPWKNIVKRWRLESPSGQAFSNQTSFLKNLLENLSPRSCVPRSRLLSSALAEFHVKSAAWARSPRNLHKKPRCLQNLRPLHGPGISRGSCRAMVGDPSPWRRRLLWDVALRSWTRRLARSHGPLSVV